MEALLFPKAIGYSESIEYITKILIKVKKLFFQRRTLLRNIYYNIKGIYAKYRIFK